MRRNSVMAVLCASTVAVVSTLAMAADDPIKSRRTIMKNVAASGGVAFQMARGQIEFDALTAELAMRALNNAALGFPELFPDGSQPKEGPTEKLSDDDGVAKSTIWEDKEGFQAAAAKLAADSAAGTAAAKEGLESFREAFKAVGSNCGNCHDKYRIKLK